MRSRLTAFAAATAVALACAGCTPPDAPDTDKPPEPQATELRDAIRAPQDRARAAGDAVMAADEKRRAQLEADGG